MNFDILSVQDVSATMKIEAGQITALKNSDIQRYGVRRFENGKMFQASRLGAAAEARLLDDTKEFGGPGVAHDYGLAPAHVEKRQGLKVSTETLAEYGEAIKALNGRHPDFVFSGRCITSTKTTKLTSNYGLDLQTSGDNCDWVVTYQRKGSGNMLDGYVGAESAQPFISSMLAEESQFITAQKTEVKLSTGRLPVLLALPMTPLAKLTNSFSVNRYKDGACLYAGQLGQQLFSTKINLVDRGYAPELGQNLFFDGEGVVRKKDELTLIEKGRFTSLLSDLRFGKKFATASTGNGLRTYNTGVQLGARTLTFEPGEKPWRELLRGIDRCLVAVLAGGGDSNDLGEFSSPVQIGYVFEKGEIVGRAPQVTIKTSVNDYLGPNLIDVASDAFRPNWTSPVLISEMDVLVN